MLKDLLQGKPIRHPLHPLLVHFPIALWLLSLVLDVAAIISPSTQLVTAARYSMAAGIAMALVAALPGTVDWLDIRADHPAKRIGLYHMLLNLSAVALYGINFALRYREANDNQTPVLPMVLSVIAMGILSISGYLGGMMVYDDGIAVGRHRRRAPTPDTTIEVSSKDAKDGYVRVAASEALAEGDSLRVQIDSDVMTVVKHDGKIYAVQEFCTHRYGPLSQGTVVDGQLMCPWHRSCFELTSGKVAQGPAKVNLKRWETSVREGSILVRV